MFHDHPYTGVGPGNYPGRYLEYSPEVGLDYRAELRQPHSLPVEVAAELGVLGLAWWFLASIALGRALWRARRQSRSFGDVEMSDHLEGLTIALIGFMVTGLFLHLDFARFFWMMVGLVVAAVRIARVRQLELESEPELVRN
jgi:O-antigen ligase